MKFALVHETRICQFVANKEECFPVAEPMEWVSVADDVTSNHTFVKGTVLPPAPQPATPALDPGDILTLKIVFNQENRLRALEGKAALTAAQFKAAVRTINSQ